MKDYLQRFDSTNPLHISWFNAVIDQLNKADPGALKDGSCLDDMWRAATGTKAPIEKPRQEVGEWESLVKALNLSQPDSVTCQSTCIAMAVGDRNIYGIRQKLINTGLSAGDPAAMLKVIQSYNVKYEYDGNASLNNVFDWLKAGEFLITHGWFTGSGHVICLDGLRKSKSSARYSVNVKDPWSEFNATKWTYDGSSKFYDGFYSELCIYAACVAGASCYDAANVYKADYVDRSRPGMYVHRIIP